ncbi:uncharacterized protein FOMMEDRAFT_23647 [Fomitiporia mediterranea MF3/22]|uniref:uncharacterized protein n=1 Tax=Fomitiporia mediterranea (strain MF3/22) TaxID=694068 RepID=UPI0004407F66|nr:uncharacterized protein FOMMEDRAFT_23647 [Fomitiporia mediterranea MF3/22]EJC98387.1 hypothetical protein FOMMEDRAFT_23647 [Fomitiporia mediterranea MF3/22]
MQPWHVVSLLSLLLSTSLPAAGQTVGLDSIHNKTGLRGTWASGAKKVLTGLGFANPANTSFVQPDVSGISYSFTDDGFYEVARYRFTANGTQPSCPKSAMNWAHGTYQLLDNGSMTFTPFGDGYQLIQDPCGPRSAFVENYNMTELYQSWRIFQDPVDGFKLHLFQFDGSPLAPQFQVSTDPNMLPTQMLRNVTPGFTSQDGFVSTGKRAVRRSGSEPQTGGAVAGGRLGDAMGASMLLCAIAGAVLVAI